MRYTIRIKRQENKEAKPFWQEFEIEAEGELSIAAMLNELNARQKLTDKSGKEAEPISWECGCMVKKCGACAMRINGLPELACSTFLQSLKGKVIVLEPLSKFPVVKDLIVDRSVVFENLKKINLWLESDAYMTEYTHEIRYQSARCLMCGCCLEVCPNFDFGKDFAGAIAPVNAYRILNEEQDTSHHEQIAEKYRKHYFEGCGKSLSCQNICPAGIPVKDGIIRKNPVTGTLGDYGAAAKEKEALTLEQQEKLLKFVENSKVYKPHLPMMQIMFGACLRISETIGLTWSDVDMKNREIHVNGQLVYYEGEEGYCFHDSETKTDAGIRTIPMTQTVYDAFRKQKELNLMLGLQSNVEIGKRSGFIFNTKHGRPIMPAGVNSFLKNIVNAYNKRETILAENENREPELMPHISAHILRHTGCTRLGENNVNPKVMQYVMGHSDAKITMNIYNHIAEMAHVENEMSKMNLPETVPAVV